MTESCNRAKLLAAAAWGRTTRRMRLAFALVFFIVAALWLSLPHVHNVYCYLPSMSTQHQKQAQKFNESKVALLVENRPFPLLAPLMLHFISVVPPDWRFRFMGSIESVDTINKSAAIREQVKAGKLDLTYIPANMTTGSQEEISRFLTTRWLYETVLQPAEWLLVFQTDSMLCANAQQSIDEYLNYDWVGAPWNLESAYGGNGGLSLRRVSAILEVLHNQQREPNSEPEDVWLSERLGHRPGARLANGTVSAVFSGETQSGKKVHLDLTVADVNKSMSPDTDANKPDADPPSQDIENRLLEAARQGAYVEGLDDWREGFYEPMGYHLGLSGYDMKGALFGTPAMCKHIWDYCPELKIALFMDVAKFVPGDCNTDFKKRWDMVSEEAAGGKDIERRGNVVPFDAHTVMMAKSLGYDTEIIDGVEYPSIWNLRAWM